MDFRLHLDPPPGFILAPCFVKKPQVTIQFLIHVFHGIWHRFGSPNATQKLSKIIQKSVENLSKYSIDLLIGFGMDFAMNLLHFRMHVQTPAVQWFLNLGPTLSRTQTPLLNSAE